MDEALLHELAGKVGGRFRLTSVVQRRLVDLMRNHDDIIDKNCGGRPIRLVVEGVARDLLRLQGPEGAAETPKAVESGG